MVSTLQEVGQVRQMLDAAARDLERAGLPFRRDIPLGAMVEVPAVALCADLFARHLDVLSIGTNDLIQYAIAIDRVDDEVNYLYDPLNPAVLRLVDATIRAGRQAAIPVSMCGEMAGNSSYTRLLLGMGLREFSVPPNALLEIKQVINESDAGALGPLAARYLEFPDPLAMEGLLARINRGP
jgi:phosphotransferase system enzyme I (PtsI)